MKFIIEETATRTIRLEYDLRILPNVIGFKVDEIFIGGRELMETISINGSEATMHYFTNVLQNILKVKQP